MKYPLLIESMEKKGVTCWDVSRKIGVSPYVTQKKINGDLELSLWEKVKIKQLLKSNLPIEEIFC